MKKGCFELSTEMVLWISRIIFVIVAVLAVVMILPSYKEELNENKAKNIMMRLYYSKDCFAFEDARVLPGVIDLDKFNEERLRDCLIGDFFIKAELVNLNKTIVNDDEFFNKEIFCGYNAFYCFNDEAYVLINNKLNNDILKVKIIMENE